MMDLGTLKTPAGIRKAKKRVGRGPASGSGKTSGKGHKGQKSRSGYSHRRGFEGGQMPLHRRLPKRGFYHVSRHPYAVVNLDMIERHFDAGAEITPQVLVEAGLVVPVPGGVKILGRGEITKRFTVKVNVVTPGAKTKIEAAGGTVELISMSNDSQGKAPAAAGAKRTARPKGGEE